MYGVIYKLVDLDNGDTYFGSSTRVFKDRIQGHMSHYKRWKDGKRGKSGGCSSFKILDRTKNYKWSTIEEHLEWKSAEDLRIRETWYIANNPCINEKYPVSNPERLRVQSAEKAKRFRDKREYDFEYLQKVKEQNRKYKQENKVHVKALVAAWRIKNRDVILAKKRRRFKCFRCGKAYTRSHRLRHLRTPYCLSFNKVDFIFVDLLSKL